VLGNYRLILELNKGSHWFWHANMERGREEDYLKRKIRDNGPVSIQFQRLWRMQHSTAKSKIGIRK